MFPHWCKKINKTGQKSIYDSDLSGSNSNFGENTNYLCLYMKVFYKTHKNCHFSYCCTFEMGISIHLQTNKSTSQLYSCLYMELIFRGKCGLRRSLAYFCHKALLSSF